MTKTLRSHSTNPNLLFIILFPGKRQRKTITVLRPALPVLQKPPQNKFPRRYKPINSRTHIRHIVTLSNLRINPGIRFAIEHIRQPTFLSTSSTVISQIVVPGQKNSAQKHMPLHKFEWEKCKYRQIPLESTFLCGFI